MAFWANFQKKSFLVIFWLNLINQDKIEVYNVKIAKNFKLHKIWTFFFFKYYHFWLFFSFFNQTDGQTHRKSVTVSHTAKTYQTNRQSFNFSSSQREFNDEWSTVAIHRNSTTFRKQILIWFFFENCRTTLRQCLTWSDKVPTTFWEYSYNNRRRSTTLTLSSLQWIDTVLVLCTVVWKFTIIFEKFISNNCVVFIPKALHLIHLIFEIFWMNVIIETSRKLKVDKKNMAFCTFLATKINKNFSKATQNSCIIYFRSPVQPEHYFENVEIKINIENLCWKIKSTETLIWSSKIYFQTRKPSKTCNFLVAGDFIWFILVTKRW